MEITTFNPLVVTSKGDDVVALFEALGFEKRHAPVLDEVEQTASTQEVRLKNENGFAVDVAYQEGMPRDMTIIRMNVRDFDEAYDFLISKGFTNASGGDKVTDTGSSRSALMVSPTGFAINIAQHIRK
jgi:hypothetical protein